MPVPLTPDQLLDLIRKSELLDGERLDAFVRDALPAEAASLPPAALTRRMIDEGLLTNFQAEQLLLGKWRGFTIGKYRVLERIGSGGMGSVYLCEHLHMGHKVAVKVLPIAKANDPAALGRFYREARAAGVLDHPNLVRAHDVDQDGDMHYLVMDYVDGVNLQRLVIKTTGPLPVARACNFIWQAARGLDHAFHAGLVHRDIKPANILLDRQGTIRVLDLGLARFYEDNQDLLTIKYDDNNVLGTADYVSPEQAHDSHEVDVRTDIYSLGATFYFCLSGLPLFPEGKVAQKLVWHQTRMPTPIRQLRPDLPADVVAIVEKMLAKKPEDRYQTPAELIEALAPLAREPMPLPTDEEIPQLSLAARVGMSSAAVSSRSSAVRQTTAASRSSTSRRREDGNPSGPPVPNPKSKAAWPQSEDRPPLGDCATPRMLACETPTVRAKSDRQPVVKVAAVAPTVVPVLARRRTGRSLLMALIVLGSTTAGVALRVGLRGQVAPEEKEERRTVLVVSRSKAPGTFSSIRAALAKARPGDRIEVRESPWEESLRLDNGRGAGKGVTIAGAAPEGATVWRVPGGHKEGQSLLHLSAVAGLTVRNFTLDGRDKLLHLVTLSGPCPGLTLEDLRLRGFGKSAVHLTNCTGDVDNSVSLRRLLVVPTQEAEAGFLLDAYADQACRQVSISDCRLEGPCQAGVLIAGPVRALEIDGTRFSGVGTGVMCRRGAQPYPIRLSLTANVFRELKQAALHFETAPTAEGSRIVLNRNRFVRIPVLARTDGFKPEPLRTPARWIWSSQSAPATKWRHFRKQFMLESAPTRAVLNIVCVDSFTVWVNGQRVGEGRFSRAERRVQAFDVASYLRQGDNVLAVQTRGRAGAAGLLVELDDNGSGIFTRTLVSDATWKETARPAAGWQGRAFDDKSWLPVKGLAPYGDGPAAWRNLIWDSVVQEHFKDRATRVFPTPSGNERDAHSPEGFPSFDATVVPSK